MPTEFEQDSLADCLARAGFDPNQAAFFIWLGVVYYISLEGIIETLRFVATIPHAEIVFDYSEPAERCEPEARAAFEERRRLVAAAGEPSISRFIPSDMDRLLRDAGFFKIIDLDRLDIAARFNPSGIRDPGASRTGAHVVHAVRT